MQRVLIADRAGRSQLIGEIRRRAEAAATPVRVVPKAEIDRLTGRGNHQGVAAVTDPFRYARFEELLSRAAPALLFLDGVMDPHNLGSLLRSADGAGFDGVVIRTHRSAQVTGAVRRVAAGAAEVVAVARVSNLSRALEEAKRAGLWIAGLDAAASQTIWSCELRPPLGMVLGSEDRGISAKVKERCDVLMRIPSVGSLESLNVAVAGALAMFEVARRR